MGILTTLSEAGAIITHPVADFAVDVPEEFCQTENVWLQPTTVTSFGRMGTSKVEIYLASPKTAAAARWQERL